MKDYLKFLFTPILCSAISVSLYSQTGIDVGTGEVPDYGIQFGTIGNIAFKTTEDIDNLAPTIKLRTLRNSVNYHGGWTWAPIGQAPIAALNTIGNFQLKNDMLVGGKLGIGTAYPSSVLDVVAPAESNTLETGIATFGVSDASEDKLEIINGTIRNNQYIPYIRGQRSSDARQALVISGQSSNDTGSDPLIIFDARNLSGTSIENRPLFQWKNHSLPMMTMSAEGKVVLGTPPSSIEALGKLHLYGDGMTEGICIFKNASTSLASFRMYIDNGVGYITRAGSNTKGIAIKKDGKVGIGDSDPKRLLSVGGANSSNGIITLNHTDGKGWATYAKENGSFGIFEYSNQDYTAGTDRLSISRGGQVEIKTNEDQEFLDQIKLSSNAQKYGLAFFGEGHHRGGIYAANSGGTQSPDGNITIWARDNGSITLEAKSVRLGTSSSIVQISNKLEAHQIEAESIKVVNLDLPDYVFDEAYELRSLDEVASFIAENKHLPEVPSADNVAEEGMNLTEMNNTMLRKIEELTLYLIEQQKEIDMLKEQNEKLMQMAK